MSLRMDIPDFIIGAPYWDIWMAAYMRLYKGFRLNSLNSLYDNLPGCELPDGLIIHQAHMSKWKSGSKAEQNKRPSNQYNRKLFQQWCDECWPNMTMDQVDSQKFHVGAIARYRRLAELHKHTQQSLAQRLEDRV